MASAASSWDSSVDLNNEFYRFIGYKNEAGNFTRAAKTNLVASAALIALFTVGCLAVGGVVSPAAVAWTGVGVGAGTFLLDLAGGNLSNRKVHLAFTGVISIALITIGILGIPQVALLSTTQVGLTMMGITGGTFLVFTMIGRGITAQKRYARAHPAQRAPQ